MPQAHYAAAPVMIGNTRVLRNADLDAISEQQLRQFAPAVFAESGMPGVSEKYGHVSTIEVVRSLADAGMQLVEARLMHRRDPGRMPFTKHMLKFRPAGKISKIKVGDVVPQTVMVNSHDRSSGYHLYTGLFRLLCSNGLMVSDGAAVEPIKVHHTKHAVANIVEKSLELVRGIDGVYELRNQMLATPMTQKSALAFASNALEFRPKRAGLLLPETLLESRRTEDNDINLWSVFNRVQENLLRGGNLTITADGRQALTRGIGRIDRDVEMNTKLWSLAVQTIDSMRSSSKRAAAKRASAESTI